MYLYHPKPKICLCSKYQKSWISVLMNIHINSFVNIVHQLAATLASFSLYNWSTYCPWNKPCPIPKSSYLEIDMTYTEQILSQNASHYSWTVHIIVWVTNKSNTHRQFGKNWIFSYRKTALSHNIISFFSNWQHLLKSRC